MSFIFPLLTLFFSASLKTLRTVAGSWPALTLKSKRKTTVLKLEKRGCFFLPAVSPLGSPTWGTWTGGWVQRCFPLPAWSHVPNFSPENQLRRAQIYNH